MALPKLYGTCGATLDLPYSDDVLGPFAIADIIFNFPSVLREPKVLKYLFNCDKVISTPVDITTILIEGSRDCVHEMIDDEGFCEKRKECFSLNRTSDNFVKQVQTFSKKFEPLTETVKSYHKALTDRPRYTRKSSSLVEEM